MIPRRPTGSVVQTNLTAVYPKAVLDYAWQIRDVLDIGRDRILWAATLAVVAQPPAKPVAYPDLNTGPTTCTVPYNREMYAAVRHVGRHRFFRRHAWMAYFGMTERYEMTVAILRLFTPELAVLERTLIDTCAAEVIPCPITKPSRAPTSRLPKEQQAKAAKPRRRKPKPPPAPKKAKKSKRRSKKG
jgi:hypothetical protein